MADRNTTISSRGRITVVHVVLQMDTGGMEKLLVEFARHADRARFNLHFVSMTTRGPVAEELELAGCTVHALNLRKGLRPRHISRLATVFRKLGADVVHLHNTKPLIYGAPAARLAGVGEIVYTRHGQRHGASRSEDFLFRAAARCAHHIVCVSRDSAARCAQDGLSPKKIRTIWNGIDPARFEFTGPKARGPIVFVGRLSPEKDIPALLRAAQRTRSQEPALAVHIAGDGPLRNQLQQLAMDLGSNVRFLGKVDDVPALLRNASACVLSSLTEGISLSLLEGMSTGLPVIATIVGGNVEVVVDGETGILVPPSDPVQLSDAMLTVWRDPLRGAAMGAAGRRRVEKHFDVAEMVRSYEALYCAPIPEDPLQATAAVQAAS